MGGGQFGLGLLPGQRVGNVGGNGFERNGGKGRRLFQVSRSQVQHAAQFLVLKNGRYRHRLRGGVAGGQAGRGGQLGQAAILGLAGGKGGYHRRVGLKLAQRF